MVLDQIEALLNAGLPDYEERVYGVGDVPGKPEYPYVFFYSLQPIAVRSLARTEGARRFRFGVTLVDLGSQHLEGDADRVEAIFEGSRALHAASRIEWVARGPLVRDAEATSDGQEPHTLPIHFTTTIPKEPA